jgi:LuxR family maltose regulon positive regulatory protein
LALAQLAMMSIEDGAWDTADELAERAAALIAPPALASLPISALVFAVAATTRAHLGRVDEAKRDLRHAVNLLARLGEFTPWYGAQTRIMLARAALSLADTVRARTLLAEASRLARRVPDAVIFQASFDRVWAQIDTLAETALSGPSSLTIAELRILRFLPSHRSFREIAERLDVSVNTVKTQAHAIYRKLDAASRSEAVARASTAGLLGT